MGTPAAAQGSLLGLNIAIDTTTTRHQLRPHVAYGANEYLVAWQHYTDNNNTTYDVYGRVLNRNGSFATNAFVIANYISPLDSVYKESPTAVAYNSAANQFLVVWEAEPQFSSGYKDIWARHVSPSGTVGSYIQIATLAGSVETSARAAYNPDNDQYLVVWESFDKPAGTDDVVGRRLTGSGVVITTDTILISTAVAENALPDVVYQPDSGRYIIVWQQAGNVYSRGVLPDGTLTGGATAVANTSQVETHPRLTADLLIWQRQNSGSGYDLYARPLDSNGLPSGEPFVIQEAPGNQQKPALAAGSNQRTQLAWQDDATGPWDLYTAVLDRSYQVTHIQYEYDPLYRLVNAAYSGDIAAGYTYTYDAVGNMTAYVETVNGQTSSVNRTFNVANQLVTAADTELGTSSFYYDANGNLTMIYKPGTPPSGRLYYQYNQRNLLTRALEQIGAGPTKLVAVFVYDGSGNRLQQIDHTGSQPVTTTYTNDILGLSQVLMSSNGTTTTYNLFGLDLISQDDGSQTRYLLTDGLGSTRTEMVGGAVETSTTYEPYGRLLAQTGATGTVYGFTGEEYDDATGLVYLRARYYNPALQVFMSTDPWAGSVFNPQTLHGYSYVKGNVVNLLDPTGECYGPFRFLRRVESTNCNNLDMAVSIVTHPNASIGQRAAAATYATAMVGSHTMLAVGSIMAAPTAISTAGSAVGTGMTYAMAYGAAHPTAAAAATLAPAAWSVMDDAVMAYGAATGDPYARQQAMIAYQIGQADGGGGLFDGFGGLRAAANIGRRGITNVLDNCAARFRLSGGGVFRGVGYPSRKPYRAVSNYMDQIGGEIGHHLDAPLFYSVNNRNGGKVWVSIDEILPSNFDSIVYDVGDAGGSAHILTGVHGDQFGNLSPKRYFYEQDRAVFGHMSNVTVTDVSELNADEFHGMLQGPNTIICAWCFSERSTTVIKSLIR